MGSAASNTLGGMFLDTPARTIKTDARTGFQLAQERRIQAMNDAMMQQYANAQSDPNWGMGDPSGQRYMEQELIDSVYNRLGAGGSLGSGTSKAAAAKAITDYRLGLLAKRNQAMEKLRGDIMGGTQAAGSGGFTVTPVEGKEAGATGMAKAFLGSYGGKAMGGI